jgi:hypothetical protein
MRLLGAYGERFVLAVGLLSRTDPKVLLLDNAGVKTGG